MSGLRPAGLLLLGGALFGGPPYLTDDPEPVPLHHWEVFLFAQGQSLAGLRSGSGPALEANYGPFQNAQLQFQIPLAYADGDDGSRRRGLGDVQAGFKFRFREESEGLPQMAVYPQVQAPTGRDADGLGAGHWRIFLPLWLQKSFGPWITYGGGGWWRNPGAGNRNYAVYGWLIQRELSEGSSLGFEVFRQGAPALDQPATTALNLGFEWGLGGGFQFIASGGRLVQGARGGQFYAGFRGSF